MEILASPLSALKESREEERADSALRSTRVCIRPIILTLYILP